MLRLEAFVDDKKAGALLHALEGLVIQYRLVPVKNATTKDGKVVGAGGPTNGPEAVRFHIQKCRAAGVATFTTKEVGEIGKTYGLSDKTIWQALVAAKRRGEVKSTKRGIYTIPTLKGAK